MSIRALVTRIRSRVLDGVARSAPARAAVRRGLRTTREASARGLRAGARGVSVAVAALVRAVRVAAAALARGAHAVAVVSARGGRALARARRGATAAVVVGALTAWAVLA